jgi:flagellar hook assembly protein FlgD
MSNNHGAATMPATTYGTMIHVEVPAGNDGPCHIRIYTLGGELVKDISDTCTGGKYNYFGWDGRNKDGQEVANGVYYGVVDLSGSKPDRKDATFKMAVIK